MTNTTQSARKCGKVVEKLGFGVVVKLDGGDEGLLHNTRMKGGSRSARNTRNQRVAVGDAVEVTVEEVLQGGRTKLQLSEQWHDAMVLAELKPGQTVRASVARVLDSGVIVTIVTGVATGVDAYMHVSELSGMDPRSRDRALASLRFGSELELEVLSVGTDEVGDTRIRVSQRAAALRAKLVTTFTTGTKHTGRVQRRTERGFVISFGDFSGILPESEMGKTGAGSIRTGSNTRVIVTGLADDGTLMLTRRGV